MTGGTIRSRAELIGTERQAQGMRSWRCARPVANTLFFAGEATDIGGHNGTVHGAIASGRRAATEIAQAVADR